MLRNTFPTRWLAAAILLGALPATAPTPAHAEAYPERPVKIVSVTSAGTGIDDYTRLLAKYLHKKAGRSFIVENKPGANTMIAADYVAKSAPDGYTLLFASASTMAANPYLFKSMPYSPRDFVPVARLSTVPVALVVSANSPYRTVADLTAAARAKPGTLNYGTSSAGYRVMLAAFNDAAGIRTQDVPYKGMANLLPDLLGGTLDFTVLEISAAVPMIESRKMRALAVMSDRRVPIMGDVPTMAEAGLPAITVVSWTGLFAPKGTPPEVLDKLQAWTLEFVNSPEAAAHHAQRGTNAYPAPGAQLARAIVEDQGNWQRMIKLAGIQPE